MPHLSALLKEAHARAKLDRAWSNANERSPKSYVYFLGLQMRNGYAEARVRRTGMAPAFEMPPQRWA